MALAERPIGEFWDRTIPLQRSLATTPMEALMSARPYYEPADSLSELQPLREAVAICMESLSPEDRFVLDAWYIERITIRDLAERMGLHKSYTHRLVKRAETRLRDHCLMSVVIQGYLGIAGAIPPQPMAVEAVADGAA